jgi:glutaredoxin
VTIQVTVLSAPHCELCEHAKKVLARVSADYDIEISVISDESEEGRALMMEHLVAFPPGVLLDGHLFSYGRLSERRLRRQLERSGAPRFR